MCCSSSLVYMSTYFILEYVNCEDSNLASISSFFVRSIPLPTMYFLSWLPSVHPLYVIYICSDPGCGQCQPGGTVPKLCQSNGAAAGRVVCTGRPAGHSFQTSYHRRQPHCPGKKLAEQSTGNARIWVSDCDARGYRVETMTHCIFLFWCFAWMAWHVYISQRSNESNTPIVLLANFKQYEYFMRWTLWYALVHTLAWLVVVSPW